MNLWPIVVSTTVAATAGAAAWGVVSPSAQLFGPTLRHTSSPKTLALTFDDGPNPSVTPRLLDLFERYSVRATFFVIGRFVRACPELVRETADRGHLLGNHTHNHAQLTFLSRSLLREELIRCQEAIAAATGTDPPKWMRPPAGRRNPMLHFEARRVGIRGVVMWSISSRDWKLQQLSQLVDRLALVASGHGSRGDIVLFHDGIPSGIGGDRERTVTALEYWLPRWRDNGVKFVTIAPPEVLQQRNSF